MALPLCELSGISKKGFKILRVIFLIINIVFWACSLALVLYLAYYLTIKPYTVIFLLGEKAVAYVLVISGIILFITGMVGYCTGVRLNRGCIKAYIALVVIFFILNLGLMSYVIDLHLGGGGNYQSSWLVNSDTQNGVQTELLCCGYTSATDYTTSYTSNSTTYVTDGELNLDVSCYNTTSTTDEDTYLYTPYTVGCSGSLATISTELIKSLVIITSIIFVAQIFGAMVATVLLLNIQGRTYEDDIDVVEEKPKQKYKMIKN